MKKLDGTCGTLVATSCNRPHQNPILGLKMGVQVRLIRTNDMSHAGFIMFHTFPVQYADKD